MIFSKGDKIGEYTVVDYISDAGASGIVYLVERATVYHTKLYALKMLNGHANNDKQNIRNEANNWSSIPQHPNVASFVDIVFHEDQIGFLSHYYEEGSLGDYLKKNDIDPNIAVRFIISVLKGVEHIHKIDIIHRDLKPANILLCDQTPLLIDFGISRFVNENMSRRTRYAGTPEYSSPEALSDIKEKSTDIWSVGVILYEMLEGHLPFDGERMQMDDAIRYDPPRPFNKPISNTLKRIILKSLEKSPYRRFQSAEEMRIQLERYQASEQARERARKTGDVVITRIESQGSPQETELLNLYSQTFPDNGTNLTREQVCDMLDKTLQEERIVTLENITLVATFHNEVLGFLFCCYYENSNMAFIPYFCVKPGVSPTLETSKKLLERLFGILDDKKCDYVFFDSQTLNPDDSLFIKFARLSDVLGLEFRRFDINYEGPKVNVEAVETKLLFFGVGISKDIPELLPKIEMSDILKFMFLEVYGDVYALTDEKFPIHQAHLKQHLDKIILALPEEIETVLVELKST